jgi:hypothetical protein
VHAAQDRDTHIVTENLNDAPAPLGEKEQMLMAPGRSQINSPRPEDLESRVRVSVHISGMDAHILFAREKSLYAA